MEERMHNIAIEMRKKVTVSLCEEVVSFNENEVVLVADGTGVVIKGSNMRVREVSSEVGDVRIEGDRIDSVQYTKSNTHRKEGFIGRILK